MSTPLQELIVLGLLVMASIVIAEYMGGPRWRKAVTAGILAAILITGWKIFIGEIVL